VQTYREDPVFGLALKATKSVGRGNVALAQPLQLITHLAWRGPDEVVGWHTGTTPSVRAYAREISLPEGTALPDAMSAALAYARKAIATEPEKDTLAVLAAVIDRG